jgi:hypothetical protein
MDSQLRVRTIVAAMNRTPAPHRVRSVGVLRRATLVACAGAMLATVPGAPLRAAEAGDAARDETVRRSGRGRDVTIIAGEDRVIYEVRQNGVLRQIRIVPDNGRPYYLVPADPTRAGDDLSTVDRLIPSWTLIEF